MCLLFRNKQVAHLEVLSQAWKMSHCLNDRSKSTVYIATEEWVCEVGFFCLFLIFWDIHGSSKVWGQDCSTSYESSALPLETYLTDMWVQIHAHPCMRNVLGFICAATLADRHMGLYDSLMLCFYSHTPKIAVVGVSAMPRLAGKVAGYHCIIPIHE